ncbi:MAG: hypothetical protein FD144_2472 [Rhodospirillaceae bacterium]|nr:MAG: hypothetical protein FD144_2472 [Rhodospirillaceae bacterium]
MSVRVVESPDDAVLHRIAEGDVALAIWHRPQAAGLAAWLDSLPAERLPEGHFIGPAACVPARLASLCDLVDLADSPERRALIDDIAGLARCFAARTGSPDVDLRLEVIAHDACWRFHRDHVGYRLNATYRGPGTQWLPLDHAARALKTQRRYRGPLNEFPRFAAGLFKGVVRAGTEAIVHRSPPVAASGQTRLFLCLNEVHDDE